MILTQKVIGYFYISKFRWGKAASSMKSSSVSSSSSVYFIFLNPAGLLVDTEKMQGSK